jgi:hypothetical protein
LSLSARIWTTRFVVSMAGLLLAVAVVAAALRTAWPALSNEVGSATARQPVIITRDTPEPPASAAPVVSTPPPPQAAAAPPAGGSPAPAGSYYTTVPAGSGEVSHRGRDGGGDHGGPGPH